MILYLTLFFGNFLNFIGNFGLFFYLVTIIYNQQRLTKKRLAAYFGMLFLYTALLTGLSFNDIQSLGFIKTSVEVWLLIIDVLANVLLFKWLFKAIGYRQIFFLTTLLNITYAFMSNVSVSLILMGVAINFWTSPLIELFIMFLLIFLLTLGAIKLFKHSRLLPYFRKLMTHKLFIVVFSVIYHVYELFALFRYNQLYENSNYWGVLLTTSFYLPLLLFLFLIARETERNHQLIQANQLVQQQQLYLTSLETIQKDLRGIQHDYKNILASMYLQAKEGRVAEIEKYLAEHVLTIDQNVAINIKKQTALAQIDCLEVKSLLLSKMLQVENQSVIVNLEVSSPVNQLGMALNDFIRVLGILIDNGIEGALATTQPVVSILLYQDDTYLNLVVKNNFIGTIELEEIWQLGYSTKGPKRGLGLSNYRSILNHYPNVLSETKVQEQQMTQSLIIYLSS